MNTATVQVEIDALIHALRQDGRYGWAQVLSMRVTGAKGNPMALNEIKDEAEAMMALAGVAA